MNEDRSGVDLLRQSIDEVADSLPSPGARPRRRIAVAWAAAALILAVALGTLIVVRVGSPSSGTPAVAEEAAQESRLGIEVKLLRVSGRDVDARVIDATKAGTIVVAPRTAPTRARIPAVIFLPGGLR